METNFLEFLDPNPKVIEEEVIEVVKKKTPFDFASSIDKKINLRNELIGYTPFMINRIYSQYRESILIANELNKYNLDHDLHYDFYFNAIPKKNRFAKWGKSEYDEKLVKQIIEYYNINKRKAIELIDLVDKESIRDGLYRGGTK